MALYEIQIIKKVILVKKSMFVTIISIYHTSELVSLEVISKVLITSEQPKRNKMASRFTLGTESNIIVR